VKPAVTCLCDVVQSHVFMRRALASLLLVIWIAGVSAPLLAQPDVPACCRADGKHHCAMHLQGAGFHAVSPTCPCAHTTVQRAPAAFALGVPAQAGSVVARWQRSSRIASAVVVTRVARSNQKRGPPLA
jgi:hypothetical protein